MCVLRVVNVRSTGVENSYMYTKLYVIHLPIKWFTGTDDVKNIVDPLTKVKAGLQSSGDSPVPLKSVHIRAQLKDLAAQVHQFCYRMLVSLLFRNTNCIDIIYVWVNIIERS